MRRTGEGEGAWEARSHRGEFSNNLCAQAGLCPGRCGNGVKMQAFTHSLALPGPEFCMPSFSPLPKNEESGLWIWWSRDKGPSPLGQDQGV